MNNNQNNVNPQINNQDLNPGANLPGNAQLAPMNPGNEGNQFVNQNQTYNDTSLNDLNVDGSYNNMNNNPSNNANANNKMNVAPEYASNPKYKSANINKIKVPITQELKTVIIIAVILLVFIIVLPMIFDFIGRIAYQ